MGVYGVALAGWSSNSKYPLLGGLRSSAQMISYELALTMSVVGVILMAGTFNLSEIVTSQQGFHWGFLPRWNLIGSPLPQILGFFLLFHRRGGGNQSRCHSIWPKRNPNWSPAFTPNTPASSSRCFSWRNTPA